MKLEHYFVCPSSPVHPCFPFMGWTVGQIFREAKTVLGERCVGIRVTPPSVMGECIAAINMGFHGCNETDIILTTNACGVRGTFS